MPAPRRSRTATLALVGLLVLSPALPAAAVGGSLTAWGGDEFGELQVGSANDVVQIAVGPNYNMALHADGTVTASGGNIFRPQDDVENESAQATVPPGLTNVVQVVAGGAHTVALRADGTVVAWGRDTQGESSVPAGLSNVVQLAAGGSHTLALRDDGTVVAWGRSEEGATDVPADLGEVVQLAAGDGHSLALLSDGSVRIWGRGDFGQDRLPGSLGEAVMITAGRWHNVAIRPDGSVVSWGYDNRRQSSTPADLAPAISIAAGIDNSAAVHADGTVTVWGTDLYQQLQVPADLSGVTSLGIGQYHLVALSDPTAARLSISGSAEVGATLTADLTTSAPAASISYQWYADGSAIDGATSDTYTVDAADAGAPILVRALSTAPGIGPVISAPLEIPLAGVETDDAEAEGTDAEDAASDGAPWAIIIAGIIVVAVIGVFVALLIRRRKQGETADDV